MSKNLIYMVAVDHHTSNTKNSEYSNYSINTWKWWCNKNDVDFMLITEHDKRFGRPVWNKELVYEKAVGYDKIGIVDSDTMIKWDTPNIFNKFEKDEFCGVVDNINFRWLYDSINVYNKFFPDISMDLNSYFNAGVLFFGNKYLSIFENVLNFYLDNQEELDNWKLGGGKEQTILNYHLVKHKVKKKELTPNWNLLGMHVKQFFSHNWQLNEDKTPFFIKYGNIWHFTGFSISDRISLMNQTWDMIKNNYTEDN